MSASTSSPLERLYLVHGRLYRVRLDYGAEYTQVRWDRPLEAFMLNEKGGIPMRFVANVAEEPRDSASPVWFGVARLAYANGADTLGGSSLRRVSPCGFGTAHA